MIFKKKLISGFDISYEKVLMESVDRFLDKFISESNINVQNANGNIIFHDSVIFLVSSKSVGLGKTCVHCFHNSILLITFA